jgi:hypothetical protein
MEEIPPPSPVATKPKTAAQRYVERTIAWIIVGGFLLGILGAVVGMASGFAVGDKTPFGTMLTYFFLGSILGAGFGLVIGLISATLRHVAIRDPSSGERETPGSPGVPEDRAND